MLDTLRYTFSEETLGGSVRDKDCRASRNGALPTARSTVTPILDRVSLNRHEPPSDLRHPGHLALGIHVTRTRWEGMSLDFPEHG